MMAMCAAVLALHSKSTPTHAQGPLATAPSTCQPTQWSAPRARAPFPGAAVCMVNQQMQPHGPMWALMTFMCSCSCRLWCVNMEPTSCSSCWPLVLLKYYLCAPLGSGCLSHAIMTKQLSLCKQVPCAAGEQLHSPRGHRSQVGIQLAPSIVCVRSRCCFLAACMRPHAHRAQVTPHTGRCLPAPAWQRYQCPCTHLSLQLPRELVHWLGKAPGWPQCIQRAPGGVEEQRMGHGVR